MHVILTGTGLVGTIALDALLKDKRVDQITIISRHAVPQADGHASVTVIIQQDLSTYSEETLAKLKGAQGCIWTVGPPMIGISKEEYSKAHIDLPARAARVLATLNDHFNFVYVSHDDCHGHPSIFFLEVKARAEERLFQLHHDTTKRLNLEGRPKPEPEDAVPNLSMYFIRPMLIDYHKYKEIKKWLKPLSTAKKWTNYIGLPVYRFFGLKSMIGDSREMGLAMVDLALRPNGEDVNVKGASPEGRCLGVVGMRNWVKEQEAAK